MQKITFLLAAWSFFAPGALIFFLKALEQGQPGRIAAAASGLTIALFFVLLLLLQLRMQRVLLEIFATLIAALSTRQQN